jgi:hypothetical protein
MKVMGQSQSHRIIHLDDAIAKIDMGIRLEVHIRNAPGD